MLYVKFDPKRIGHCRNVIGYSYYKYIQAAPEHTYPLFLVPLIRRNIPSIVFVLQ